jgi:hypothetical protein
VGRSEQTRAELVWVAGDYDALIRGAGAAELRGRTRGTRWTNEQLLFHMWFGQRIARALVPVVGGLSRLPPGASLAWSRLLSSMTGPYDWVNYEAAVVGVRGAGLRRARRWMRQDTAWLLRWGDGASAEDLARGMSVPAGWDPYFALWMSRSDVLAWAPKHYRHHRAQLTLTAVQD